MSGYWIGDARVAGPDARLDDRAVAVDQHGELRDRPQPGEILPRARLLHVPVGERRPVLPQRHEDILGVG